MNNITTERQKLLDILGIDKPFSGVLTQLIVNDVLAIANKFDITNINEDLINAVIEEAKLKNSNKIFFSMIFTYIWKHASIENREKLFEILDSGNYLSISCLNQEYATEAARAKYRRSDKKKYANRKIIAYDENKKVKADFSNYEALATSLKVINKLKDEDKNESILNFFETVMLNVTNEKENKDILLAKYLLQFPLTTIINNKIDINMFVNLKFINVSFLENLSTIMNVHMKDKQFINEKERGRTLSYLLLYTNFYLPMAYQLGLTDIEPISSIEDFKGSFFVSTPIPIKNKRLPLSLIDFIKTAASFRSEDEHLFTYTILRSTKDFFDDLISRRESYRISDEFTNPILTSNLPKTNKLKESSKVRMPSEMFWMFLYISKKVITIVNEVNQAIIDGKMTPNLLRAYFQDGELDLTMLKSKIHIDNFISHNNKDIEIKKLRQEIFSFNKYRLKSGRKIELISPLPLIHLAVSLETGLRHQSIQWLSDDFDHKIVGDIDENELYELFIKTDKIKQSSWYSFVSGRVINLLRAVRDFKAQLNCPAFEKAIPYDGHGKRWGSYKILFSYNTRTGNTYSDNLYSDRFKCLLCCVEDLLPEIGFDYKIYKNENDRKRLSCPITPHSTRVTIVSELVNYLPPEYISRHVTGHSPQTVTYYTKHDTADIRKFKEQHKKNFKESLDNFNGDFTLPKIIPDDVNSNLVKSFKEDYHNALNDFGCATIDDESWKDLIEKEFTPRLSFESTHICPFSSICPKIVLDKGIDHDCFKCPYAIRSVDHLPALCAKRREIIEIITSIEDKLMKNDATHLNKSKLQEKRKALAEELAYYSVIIQVLDANLNKLKNNEVTYVSFTPDAIKKDIVRGHFPSDSDAEYVLSRLEEVNNFPDLETPEIKAKISFLTTKILVASNNVRELMKEEYHGESSSLHTYSLIKSLLSSKQLTRKDLLKISNLDINAMKEQPSLFLLETKNAK
jgi:hypothetical protein